MKDIISQEILGVRIDFGLSMADAVSRIEGMLSEKNKQHLICTTNPEFIMDAQKDRKFRSIINSSALSLPDGIGVLFAKYYLDRTKDIKSPFLKFLWGTLFGFMSFFKSFPVGERVSGVDLALEVMKLSSSKGYSVFMLGGWPKDLWGNRIVPAPFDMATLAATKAKEIYPNVNIIGASSSFNRDSSEDEITVEYIKKCMKDQGIKELDFLLVAYNHKHQEEWYVRNASKIPAKIGVGLGGTFDYLSGYLPRPKGYKLEWLKKIFLSPTKISRILRAFPMFPLKVYLDSIGK